MRRHTQRVGFAMVTAIVLLGLVALTLASMGVAFVFQSQRTLSLAQDAQLRQLLLAGTFEARTRLAASGLDKPVSLDLPDDLREQGATLKLEPQPDTAAGQITIQIEATLPRHRMAQRIHLLRLDTRWQVISADLMP